MQLHFGHLQCFCKPNLVAEPPCSIRNISNVLNALPCHYCTKKSVFISIIFLPGIFHGLDDAGILAGHVRSAFLFVRRWRVAVVSGWVLPPTGHYPRQKAAQGGGGQAEVASGGGVGSGCWRTTLRDLTEAWAGGTLTHVCLRDPLGGENQIIQTCNTSQHEKGHLGWYE